jgi:hypothetical protein
MTELKISISNDLVKKMENHPEINWNSVASNAIKNYLMKLELNEGPITDEELVKLSEQSLKEFLENEPEIYTDQDLVKRYK